LVRLRGSQRVDISYAKVEDEKGLWCRGFLVEERGRDAAIVYLLSPLCLLHAISVDHLEVHSALAQIRWLVEFTGVTGKKIVGGNGSQECAFSHCCPLLAEGAISGARS
jgi:hypothetical protein